MTERGVDFEAVSRDDRILDLLGRGGQPTDDDPVVQALYLWRADLDDGVDARLATNHAAPAIGIARVNGVRPADAPRNGHRPADASLTDSVDGLRSVNGFSHQVTGSDARRDPVAPAEAHADNRRQGRRRAAVAAMVVGLSAGLGGVAVAAADARPGSPLWPITKVIYSDTAADRQASADAQAALSRARRALAQGRMGEAERYLDEADRRAADADPDDADALRHQVDSVREQLEEQEDGDTGRDPSPSPAPSATGSEDEAPVTTPGLPSPGATDGASKDDNQGREPGGNDDHHGGNNRTKGESATLSVPDYTIMTKQLPEF